MSQMPLPGTPEYGGPAEREYRYVSDDGRRPFDRLFRDLTSITKPRQAKSGGAIAENCAVEVPDGRIFQAISYRGDVEEWRTDVTVGAKALGLRLGWIDGRRLVIDDGSTFALSECVGRFY